MSDLPPGRRQLFLWAAPVLLFAAALAPRLLAVGRYVTPDELIWVYRTIRFREALLAGAWGDTLVAGHPGVVTTWLGTLGISLQLWLRPADQLVYDWITHLAFLRPENVSALRQLATFLTAGRVAVAAVNAAGVVLVYRLARSLWGLAVALPAALWLAWDPFLAGLSGLLHVDGLMATLATLSLLTLIPLARPPAASGDPGRADGWAGAAGATAALAILTKSPALLLAPLTGLALAAPLLVKLARRQGDWLPFLRRQLRLGAIWLAALLLTAVLLFPALWQSPVQVVSLAGSNAGRHLEEALRPTYFLGEVTFEHGPAFYPVALALRLSPPAFLGLLLALGLAFSRAGRRRLRLASTGWLLLWTVLFLLGVTLAAKKFDRYLLPVLPALTLTAAVAWSALSPLGRRRWWPAAALTAAQLAIMLWAAPFLLAAYNPLLGGSATARRTLTVGWGEGIGAAGAWLADQAADAGASITVASILPSLAPFFPGRAALDTDANVAHADYLVVTVADWQTMPDTVAQRIEGLNLRHVLRFAGLDQAWIYRQPNPAPLPPPPAPLPEPVTFGGQVRLAAVSATATADDVDIAARWSLPAPTADRFRVLWTLRDAQGQPWAGREADLVNDVDFYPRYWTPGAATDVAYSIKLPPAMPSGPYQLTLALFAADGTQLPLTGADGQFRGTTLPGPGVVVPAPAQPPSLVELEMAAPLSLPWTGGLTLLGRGSLPDGVVTGDQFVMDLFWQAQSTPPPALEVTWRLGSAVARTVPLSGWDTGQWRPGEVVHAKYTLPVSPTLPGGEYLLSVAPAGEAGVPLGPVTVVATDRLFRLPGGVTTPLAVDFGVALHLRGMDPPPSAAPGETAELTLYWQTDVQPADLLTAFVHVIAPEGQIVAQSDHWPGSLPSQTWAPGQVIVDPVHLSLPPELPPGMYRLAVGVYTPADGVRLSATDAAGQAIPDDRYFLPVSLTVR